jgi:hypothetical protein
MKSTDVSVATPSVAVPSTASCKLCTINLERLCYQRAWWFRVFRNTLAAGVYGWSWWHSVDPKLYQARSRACHGCLRFRKNVLREESPFFRWVDGYLNPLFNRVRDGLLSEEELAEARRYAAQAAQGDTDKPVGQELRGQGVP